jgi:hypothetical protein
MHRQNEWSFSAGGRNRSDERNPCATFIGGATLLPTDDDIGGLQTAYELHEFVFR